MTIAELRGKLSFTQPSSINDRLEDLLTSDVFGTMKYAGWQNGFIDWILKAIPASITPLPPSLEQYIPKEKVTNIEYCFWPTLKNMREPDVALLLEFHDGTYLLICIEAKFLSGTSDWENESDYNSIKLTGNQIADQVQGLTEMSTGDIFKWFELPVPAFMNPNEFEINCVHIFLTAHMVFPNSDFKFADTYLNGNWPIPSYWLPWNSLAACLEPHKNQNDKRIRYLIKDLYDLLKRKDLIPFDGFKIKPWSAEIQFPNFWTEIWFLIQWISISEYKSFWKNNRFQTRESFWKEVAK